MKQAAEYDLIAIGGGTAGLVTVAGAKGIGAPRVAVIEKARLGGECLWTGCVPSKALIACARAAADTRSAARFGIHTGEVLVDAAGVWEWVRSARARIEPHDSPERFRALGVDVISGEARFTGERTLSIDGRIVTAERIVIATGSRPALPPIGGLGDGKYYTNETLFDLRTLPKSLIILGAGAIGLEMAQAFVRLGTGVTVVEMSPQLLVHEDRELAELLGKCLAAEQVNILLGTKAVAVTYGTGAGAEVTVQVQSDRGGGSSVSAEALLVATGRRANIESLGLDAASVGTDKNGILVSSALQTGAPNVWAAGDVTGTRRFTHVAEYEARLVVRNAFFPFAAKADYRVVPWVTFTDPDLAHLGLTEEEARDRFGNRITVWRTPFNDVDRAITDGQTTGMVKLIADSRGHLLGAHVLGRGAGNMIGEITVAMRADLSLSDIANTIHAYPTYPDAIRQAANQYQRSRFTGLVKRIANWFAAH